MRPRELRGVPEKHLLPQQAGPRGGKGRKGGMLQVPEGKRHFSALPIPGSMPHFQEVE